MPLTENEVADVRTMLAIGLSEMRDAIAVAKDEAIRVNVLRLFYDDASDMSHANRDKCVKARAVFRKMYKAHADGVVCPWTLAALKAGLSKKQIQDHFDGLPDPAPDSETFRTPKT